MSGYADCYAMSSNRTMKFVNEFLNTFMPNRKRQCDSYEVEMPDGETKEFDSDSELLQFLEDQPSIPYTIYWENLEDKEPRLANCVFTDDNYVIAGLGCLITSRTEEDWLHKLFAYCETRMGYIAYQEPAPRNSLEFINLVKSLSAREDRAAKRAKNNGGVNQAKN